jgi:hypothetical protein
VTERCDKKRQASIPKTPAETAARKKHVAGTEYCVYWVNLFDVCLSDFFELWNTSLHERYDIRELANSMTEYQRENS